MKRSNSLQAALLMLCCALSSAVSAETIVNRWKPVQMGAQGGAAVAQANAPSSRWIIEPTDDGFVRIKNADSGLYLHVEHGLAVGTIQPGWWSAQWKLEPTDAGWVRIINRWTGVALNIEQGPLAATQAPPNWWSAQWPGGRPTVGHRTGGRQADVRR